MSIHNTLYFNCYRSAFDKNGIFRYGDFDLSSFIIRLLLFDDLIIESIRLEEIHNLIGAFGANGLILLLETGAIKFKTYISTIAQVGQAGGHHQRHRLPLGSFCFEILETRDQNNITFEGQRLRSILDTHSLTQQQKARLSDLVLENILGLDGLGIPVKLGIQQLATDVSSTSPEIRLAVAMALSRRIKKPVMPSEFRLELQTTDEDQYHAESDIRERFGLEERGTHDVIGEGLLAIAGLNERIARMEQYGCLTVFRDDEYNLLDTKLTSIFRRFLADSQVERFKRVISITGVPDLDHQPGWRVNVGRLLKIRRSAECKEFRNWLPDIDSETDEEIAERFKGINSRLAVIAHGKTGEVVRWVATNGIGAFGPIGIIAGPAASLLDTFIFDKILKRRGPEAFLSKYYPTIFSRPWL